MKILLFGSSGAFGTAVDRVCKNRKIKCIGLTHNDFEITNPRQIKKQIKKHKPDVVVNSVALVGINPCELDPQKAYAVNSIAVSNLAKICKKEDIVLVQTSTHAIFDGKRKKGYYTENSSPNPTNIYSASKYDAECFIRNICDKHYITRFPTLFGKRRNKSMGITDKILKWIKEGKELRIADDKVDAFGYTNDLANLLISILEERKPFGTYHLNNSEKASYYDFAVELIKLLGTDTKVLRAKDREFKSVNSAYKPLKTPSKSIKLKPIRSWQEALSDYINNEIKPIF